MLVAIRLGSPADRILGKLRATPTRPWAPPAIAATRRPSTLSTLLGTPEGSCLSLDRSSRTGGELGNQRLCRLRREGGVLPAGRNIEFPTLAPLGEKV
jgi:hypothetical protein